MQQNQHLILYDGECGICNRVVLFLLKADKKRLFQFAPLQGETAKTLLPLLPKSYQNEDTLVIVQNWRRPNRKFYILAKGSFMIFWLLGGWWRLIGWLSFLPGFLYNWAYRLFARHRHLLSGGKECSLIKTKEKNRFLP